MIGPENDLPAAGGADPGSDTRRLEAVLAENERLRTRVAELEEAARQATGERVAQEATLAQQRNLLSLERTVYEISRRLIHPEDLHEVIDEALARVGALSDASRAYLFTFSEDRSRMYNQNEWCAPGVSPQIDNLQDIPSAAFPWWMEQMRNWRQIQVPDVSQMPPEADASRAALEEQNVRSLLVLPFAIGGQLGGFVGFDNIHAAGEWSEASVLLLDLLAQALGHALEREQAISELKAREAQLATLIEYAPVMIDAFSDDRRCTMWNKECERITGVSAEAILAAPDPLALLFPEESFREALWEDILRGDGQYREYRAPLPDGRPRWHLWADYRLPGGGVIGTGLDITERKEAEEALRASEERYRTLVEDMPALICRFLPDGTLLFVNEAYSDYFGLTPSELVGRSFLELIPAEERQYVRDHMASLTMAEPVTSYEHRVLAPDGTLRWQRWTDRALFGTDGQVIEYHSVGLDITERREMEEQLAQYQANLEEMVNERTAQLLEANAQLLRLGQLRDEFVSNVSHEFRTPLANLLLYIELAQKNPARLTHYLSVLQREGKRLQQILEAMIDIASLDRQERVTKTVILRLDELLMNLVVDRQTLAAEKQVQAQIEGVLPALQIEANKDKVNRLFDIILTNAFTYTPAGGRITLTGEVEEDAGRRWARVSVADTGLGLTDSDRNHLFQRFYRGDAARRLNVAGTGLGLAIARGLALQVGGRIEIGSGGPDAGTTVSIWLPEAEEG